MARSILAPPSVFLSETCPAVSGPLTHLSHRCCSPSPYLEGPWDSGMSQSVGACRVPLGLSSPLSWHRRVTLASQSGSHSSCPSCLSRPLPRSPGCLKHVSSGVCKACAPSCGPQNGHHPCFPSAHQGPVLTSCSCWKLLKTRESVFSHVWGPK